MEHEDLKTKAVRVAEMLRMCSSADTCDGCDYIGCGNDCCDILMEHAAEIIDMLLECLE